MTETIIGNPRKYVDLTPDPRVLIALSHNAMRPLDALSELIDNSIDSFLSYERNYGKKIANPIIKIDLPKNKDLQNNMGFVRIQDNGPGMSVGDAEKALKAGYSSNNSYDGLGLFGLGFNISTSKMGKLTRLITTRQEDQYTTEIELDLNKLIKSGSYRVEPKYLPKTESTDIGTTVEISEWWPNGTQNGDFIKKLINMGNPTIREEIGRRYATYIRDNKVQIIVNGEKCKPFEHCVWGMNRFVIHKGEQIPALFEFNEHVGTTKRCADCRALLLEGMFECPSCKSTHFRNVEERVYGWVGIQRFDDTNKYGIDLIRNGRCIRKDEKTAFFEFTDDRNNTIKDYPIDSQYGRIVGEVHLDFVPVDYTKQDFERTSDEWAKAMKVLRGESSLQPTQPGADQNTSFIYKLFQGYRRVRTVGKVDMYMGFWSPNAEKAERISRDIEKDYYERFKNHEEGYYDDAKWWELVEKASVKPVDSFIICSECGSQILKDAEVCPVCNSLLKSKTCLSEACGKLIPFSAKVCPECGANQVPKVMSKWTCAICGSVNPPEYSTCSRCHKEQGELNPLCKDYLLSVSDKKDSLSISKLTITLPDGANSDELKLSTYITRNPIVSPITEKRLPLVIFKSLKEVEVFVDLGHSLFQNYNVTVEGFIASEVAAYIHDLSQSHGNGNEYAISNMMWQIIDKYWSHNIGVSASTTLAKCNELVDHIRDKIIHSLDRGDACEFYAELSKEQQKKFADNLIEAGKRVEDVGYLKESGEYLRYVSPEFLMKVYDNYPDAFFNNHVWEGTLNIDSSDLDEDVLKSMFQHKISEYRNTLETVILFTKEHPNDILTVQKVEYALKFLNNKLVP